MRRSLIFATVHWHRAGATLMKQGRRSLLLLACLAGCGAPPVTPPAAPPAAVPADPVTWYLDAARAGKAVYRIDAQQSLITIVVRRGGPLARFGHDHVVASRGVTGFAAPDQGRADFQFRLDAMSVDEPGLRLAAQLTTNPSPDAVEGTRANMLTRVLEADRYPLVQLSARSIKGDAGMVRLAVTLHGVTKSVDVPTRIARSAAALDASGELALRQTDFGIKPMSVMGGAMVVQDTMELRFRIHARRHP